MKDRAKVGIRAWGEFREKIGNCSSGVGKIRVEIRQSCSMVTRRRLRMGTCPKPGSGYFDFPIQISAPGGICDLVISSDNKKPTLHGRPGCLVIISMPTIRESRHAPSLRS